jgi:hypothetical protein
MAPAIPKKGRPARLKVTPAEAPPQPTPPTPPQPQAMAGPVPAQLVALLQRVRAEVEEKCEYVGSEFAEEARKIHLGETKARGIYGEASSEEAEALKDEGIDIAQIPWVPRADG